MQAILDADIIAYQAASLASGQGHSVDWGDGAERPDEASKPFCRSIIESKVREWTRLAKCGTCKLVLSDTENFRKEVHPQYKDNRKDMEKPNLLGYAKEYLRDNWRTYTLPRLEGDDVISLLLTGENAGRYVGVSTDKDLLTIPGNILVIGKHKHPIKQTLHAADLMWMTQTITGDAVDNYKGAPGAGPKAAEAALRKCETLRSMWDKVLEVYAEQHDHKRWYEKFMQPNAYQEALMNARCARLLRYGDWNKETKEIKLWTP